LIVRLTWLNWRNLPKRFLKQLWVFVGLDLARHVYKAL